MAQATQESNAKDIGVAVITPSGTFPNSTDLRRVRFNEKIEVVLAAAARALELTSTADWVVSVDERDLNPQRTFHEEGLACVVEIEWHKREGGGGASGVIKTTLR